MSHYIKSGGTLGVSLLLMFVLSSSRIASIDHFYLNLSSFYMALIIQTQREEIVQMEAILERY